MCKKNASDYLTTVTLGQTADQLQHWWQTLADRIPAKYNSWARVLLVDANARVGQYTSRNIGGHQAENETEKSEPFRNFVVEQDIWLPSTFEAYQCGPGLTWNNSTRNDFVGLPVRWPITHCQAWIDQNIDLTTTKEDHSVALVDVSFHVRLANSAYKRPRKPTEETVLAHLGPDQPKVSNSP